MNRETKLKILKLSLIIIVAVAIVFTIGMIVLTYHVEGETNLPFKITKIVEVSSSEGVEKQDGEDMWALDINQNNDIYIYIEKNKNYGKTEIIDKIKINNFEIKRNSSIGEFNIYKPSEESNEIFVSTENNKTKEIIYTGELQSNVRKNQISNQGGIVVFRCANDKVGEYISNEVEEVNYSKLLEKTGITSEDLKATISFDITIELISKKVYKATSSIELPIGDIIHNPTESLEITDLSNIVFKRIDK
ncbi:MAG: hypothetical protein HFJ48_06660 [Clostridia bacterium]|nr:hypothetical protein [Clostridia bacterium]